MTSVIQKVTSCMTLHLWLCPLIVDACLLTAWLRMWTTEILQLFSEHICQVKTVKEAKKTDDLQLRRHGLQGQKNILEFVMHYVKYIFQAISPLSTSATLSRWTSASARVSLGGAALLPGFDAMAACSSSSIFCASFFLSSCSVFFFSLSS